MAISISGAAGHQTHSWKQGQPSILVGHYPPDEEYVRVRTTQEGYLITTEINGTTGTFPPAGGGTNNGTALVTDVATLVIPATQSRESFVIYNGGPGMIFIGNQNVVPFQLPLGPDAGVPLPVGGYYSSVDGDDPYDIYAICLTGQTANVVYRETYK